MNFSTLYQYVKSIQSPSITTLLGGFNLLPYRSRQASKQRQKHNISMLIACLLGIVIAVTSHYSLLYTTHRYKHKHRQLQNTLLHMQPQLALSIEYKKPLQAQKERMDLAQSMSKQMGYFSNVLNGLGQIDPIGIHLLDLHFQSDFITLAGTARTQRQLSDWIRHLKRIGPFPNIRITQLQRLKTTHPSIPSTPSKLDPAPAYVPVRNPLPTSFLTQPFSRTPPNASHNGAHAFTFIVQFENHLRSLLPH